MRLSDCKSLDDLKRFKEGAGESGRMWTVDKNDFAETLFPTEYHIVLSYSGDKFIWEDDKGNDRYEDLYNNRKEAEKTAYLKSVQMAKEASDKAKERLDWLLANPPKDD
jgi:hypothetical protein